MPTDDRPFPRDYLSRAARAAALLPLLALLSPAGAGALTQESDAPAAVDASDTRPSVRAERIEGTPPAIDGRLEEPAWEEAETATGFTQRMPDPGAPATERTEVRVLYDGDALYVGMRLHDDGGPDAIVSRLARRDPPSDLYSDWAHLLVDSGNDRRTAFRFSVNPAGVEKDVLHFDDVMEDVGWDAVWEAATAVDSLGWTAEFRIPLSQLRFSTGGGEAGGPWGINFGREIARRGERSEWAPVPPGAGAFVSLSGELRGLGRIEAPRRLEVMPYSVARLTREPGDPENPFHDANAVAGSGGVDFQYGLTAQLTLTGTANPDFGQVEADPSQVNLTAFETFFPERRPFFTEDSDIFRSEIGYSSDRPEALFYTRRIGRTPQRVPDPEGAYVDVADAAPILGAAKLSGRSNGWSIGVLNAVTGPVEARLAEGRGRGWREPAEPLTNYAVARLSRDMRGGESTLGGILTATNRRLDDERLEFLGSAAYAGRLQGRHRFTGGDYEVSGWLAGSHVRGSEEALLRVQEAAGHFFQRPDAGHLTLDPGRTSLTGTAGHLWASKIGGGNWRGGVGGHFRSPGFEVNDVGFQNEADIALAFGNLSYVQYESGPAFRSWSLGVNPSASWDFGGQRLSRQINLFGGAEFHNLWNASFFLSRRFSGFDKNALRGGPTLRRPASSVASASLETDRRRSVSGGLSVFAFREDDTGGRELSVDPVLNVRPSGRVGLSLTPGITWNDDPWQFVETVAAGGGSRYLVGRVEQTTASLTARLNYAFTPDLSFELYAEPFLSAGDFSEFREVVEPRAGAFESRFRTFGEEEIRHEPEEERYAVDLAGDGEPDFRFADPDFRIRRFNLNAVLRWEFRPGSTLFVVWSQERDGAPRDGRFGLGREAADLFREPATNVFLVKLSYWLSP